MDARRNFELAHGLVDGVKSGTPLSAGRGEPECRCAIGRAYYAAFLSSRHFLISIGLALPPIGSSHTTVQHALSNAGYGLLGLIANALRALYILRTSADYDLSDTASESLTEATGAVARCEFVLTALDLIRAGRVNPPIDRSAAATAILAWAKANGQESRIRGS
jgi:hypothetical protein